MKNKVVFVIALLVGILAFYLSARHLSNELRKIYKDAEEIQVIAAASDLPASTVIKAEDLGLKTVYKKAVGDDVFKPEDLQRIIGKRLNYAVKRNSPLRWSYVDMPRAAAAGLAPVITSGMRAVSIAISGAPSVGGLVKPGDHVDILGTFTFPSPTNPKLVESATLTLMQNVTVLATGLQMARQATETGQTAQGGYSTVTLELSPQYVEILVFAQQSRGELYLSLRNPDDVSFESEIPSVNFDYLEAQLKPLNEQHQQELRRTKP